MKWSKLDTAIPAFRCGRVAGRQSGWCHSSSANLRQSLSQRVTASDGDRPPGPPRACAPAPRARDDRPRRRRPPSGPRRSSSSLQHEEHRPRATGRPPAYQPVSVRPLHSRSSPRQPRPLHAPPRSIVAPCCVSASRSAIDDIVPFDLDLARRPPVAVERSPARDARELVEGHPERRRELRRDPQHRLLLAPLVAADLPNVHTHPVRELGLREPELPAPPPDHVAELLHGGRIRPLWRQYPPLSGLIRPLSGSRGSSSIST